MIPGAGSGNLLSTTHYVTQPKETHEKCFAAMITGVALTLTGTTAFAMSELSGITVAPLWPSNSFPGGLLLYEVCIERRGLGLLEVPLSAESLPAGCSATFSKGSIRFVSDDPRYDYFTMSIQGVSPAAVDCRSFSITGVAHRETIIYVNAANAAQLWLGPVPPQLMTILHRLSGGFEIRGLGDTGQACRIEASFSLVKPTRNPVGACTADGNGRFTFFDTSLTQGATAQFYRASKVVLQG